MCQPSVLANCIGTGPGPACGICIVGKRQQKKQNGKAVVQGQSAATAAIQKLKIISSVCWGCFLGQWLAAWQPLLCNCTLNFSVLQVLSFRKRNYRPVRDKHSHFEVTQGDTATPTLPTPVPQLLPTPVPQPPAADTTRNTSGSSSAQHDVMRPVHAKPLIDLKLSSAHPTAVPTAVPTTQSRRLGSLECSAQETGMSSDPLAVAAYALGAPVLLGAAVVLVRRHGWARMSRAALSLLVAAGWALANMILLSGSRERAAMDGCADKILYLWMGLGLTALVASAALWATLLTLQRPQLVLLFRRAAIATAGTVMLAGLVCTATVDKRGRNGCHARRPWCERLLLLAELVALSAWTAAQLALAWQHRSISRQRWFVKMQWTGIGAVVLGPVQRVILYTLPLLYLSDYPHALSDALWLYCAVHSEAVYAAASVVCLLLSAALLHCATVGGAYRALHHSDSTDLDSEMSELHSLQHLHSMPRRRDQPNV